MKQPHSQSRITKILNSLNVCKGSHRCKITSPRWTDPLMKLQASFNCVTECLMEQSPGILTQNLGGGNVP